MGGAMDLVASAENIIVAMQHTNRKEKANSSAIVRYRLPVLPASSAL